MSVFRHHLATSRQPLNWGFVGELFSLSPFYTMRKAIAIITLAVGVVFDVGARSVFDLVMTDTIPGITHDYKYMYELGANNRAKLYWCEMTNYSIFLGNDGTSIAGDVFPDTIIGDTLFCYDRTLEKYAGISLNDLKGETFMTFKPLSPQAKVDFAIHFRDALNEEESMNYCRFSVDELPKDIPYRDDVMRYVSNCLHSLVYAFVDAEDELTENDKGEVYNPPLTATMQDVLDYYASIYCKLMKEYLMGDGLVRRSVYFDFNKVMETVDYESFYCFWYAKSQGTMWLPIESYVTFDKRNGKRIGFCDVFKEGVKQQVKQMLKKELDRQTKLKTDFPSLFNLSGATITDVALTPGYVHFSFHPLDIGFPYDDYQLILGYDELRDLMKPDFCPFDTANIHFFNIELFPDNGNVPLKTYDYPGTLPDFSFMPSHQPSDKERLLYNDGCNLENAAMLWHELLSATDAKTVDQVADQLFEIYVWLDENGEGNWKRQILDVAQNVWLEHRHTTKAKTLYERAVTYFMGEKITHQSFLPDSVITDFMCYEGEDGENLYAVAVAALSAINLELKDIPMAAGYAKRAASIISHHVRDNYDKTSRKMWLHHGDWYQRQLPYMALITNEDTLRMAAFNALLQGKELLLNTSLAMRQAVFFNGDTSIKKTLNDFDRLKNDLLRLKKRKGTDRKDIENIRDSINQLEGQLTEFAKVHGFADMRQLVRVNCAEVGACLRPGELAIEFVEVPMNGDTLILALVMQSQHKIPDVKMLCHYRDLPDVRSVNQDLQVLYRAIWWPLQNYLSDKSTIYFSPSGILNHFSLEYAQNENNEFLHDCFNVYRLSSTRQIVMRQRQDSTSSTASIYGGLKYDGDRAFLLREKHRYGNVSRGMTYRSSFNSDISRSLVAYLPGSKKEAVEICHVLNHDGAQRATLYSEEMGTEGSFKLLSGKRCPIIHLATHGWYLNKNDIAAANSEDAALDYESEALERACLLMAGVNATLMGLNSGDDVDDGLLNALEIASMDLTGLRLVVLSACETGAGDIDVDGVNGLQRGFKKAGAQSIIMSLRRVYDTSTMQLMVRFYRNLEGGMAVHRAFDEALNWVRTFDEGKYADPVHWANFVMLDALVE